MKKILQNISALITVVLYISFSYYIVKAQITISDIKKTAVILNKKGLNQNLSVDTNKNETSLFFKKSNFVCTFTNSDNLNDDLSDSDVHTKQNNQIKYRSLSLSDIPGFIFQ